MRRAVLVLAFAASPALAQGPEAAREGAWSNSVTLEQQGKLTEARDRLLRGWGTQPDSYEVALRLGWLSLLLEEADEAIAFYRRARGLPGAGEDARMGLASALALKGFEELEQADRSEARTAFAEALQLEPNHGEAGRGMALLGPLSPVVPEAWVAYLSQTGIGSSWTGWSAFGHLRWQINDIWRVRGAYRHAELTQSSTKAPQNEVYAGVAMEAPYVGFELLGFVVDPKYDSTAYGQASSLRLGKTFGLLVEDAVFKRDTRWSGQLSPQLFWWPWQSLGLQAGVRATFDDTGKDLSARLGITWIAGAWTIVAQGHLGTERWPVGLAAPIVLNIPPDLTLGGTGTIGWDVTPRFRLYLQGQGERMEFNGQTGLAFIGAVGASMAIGK